MSSVALAGATLWPVRLPLRAPLATAHGPIEAREGFVLQLIATSGAQGVGEALPLPAFGGEGRSECERALRACLETWLAAGHAASDELDRLCAPVARAALRCALDDLQARERGVSLAELWGGAQRSRVAISALVTGSTPEAVATSAAQALGQGFRTLKLKVGLGDPGLDLARTEALRDAAGPGAELRLDANGAWTETQALARLRELARFDPDFVEQPVAACDLAALARLRSAGIVRVAADEAAAGRERAERVLRAGAADLLVVKLPLFGGAEPLLRVARRARDAGVPLVLTSFLDSALGRTAALALAAALPEPLPAAGLATGGLLERDLAATLRLERGGLRAPDGPGLGLALREDLLRAAADGPALELRR